MEIDDKYDDKYKAALRVAESLRAWWELQQDLAEGEFPELEDLDTTWNQVLKSMEAYEAVR